MGEGLVPIASEDDEGREELRGTYGGVYKSNRSLSHSVPRIINQRNDTSDNRRRSRSSIHESRHSYFPP